ncbi:hypothetical protein F1C16_09125 [Hymenobacter sp. NBH84]|uniref:hypothetical protein n=1 Tax=Hymenobacter sp. NBH84 TaxID=2596915 RepID=UPI00162A816D|nr:hypothetical protein [Hymenobacter sp. NBH84]QNE39703.1 hypothetical protein F1C16_09125 [Hymenobacter sp. NBH84]
MKQCFIAAICMAMLGATSCQKADVEPEDTAILHEKLHGKYKLLSASSSEAVDSNNDGLFSTDLLAEEAYLANADVEIRILNAQQQYTGGIMGHLFVQWWQRPYVNPYSTSADNTKAGYVMQAAPEKFTFDATTQTFHFTPREIPDPDWPAPVSVTVTANEELVVVSKLPVYSSTIGVHFVTVTAHYKRYTIVT